MRRREATKVSASMLRPGSVCVRRARGEEEEESLFKADAMNEEEEKEEEEEEEEGKRRRRRRRRRKVCSGGREGKVSGSRARGLIDNPFQWPV